MKKTILIIAIGLLLVSCSNPYLVNIKGYKILNESLEVTWPFVANHKYFEPTPHWQSPQQFEAAAGGVCVGFAVDMIYHLGPEASFVICKMSWSPVGQFHALVGYKGQYLEPQENGKYRSVGDGSLLYIEKTQNYYDVMFSATNIGTKRLGPSWIDEYEFESEPAPK